MSRLKGFKHTDETKTKIREAHKGISRPPMTDTQKEKIAEAMKEWHSKHTHWNWKGGLTKLLKDIRRSPELYQWRKAVLRKDNYTCQDCGGTKNIATHHIKSVLDYPKLICEVDNGLTLCRDCHKRHTSWQWLKTKRRKHKNENGIKSQSIH